jgi:hypothetical protein
MARLTASKWAYVNNGIPLVCVVSLARTEISPATLQGKMPPTNLPAEATNDEAAPMQHELETGNTQPMRLLDGAYFLYLEMFHELAC